jgi:hypothetical protein
MADMRQGLRGTKGWKMACNYALSRIRSVSALNRELLRGISGIIETADGDLWLNGLSGIVHLPRSELSEALRDPSYQLKGHRIGRRAGLPGFPAQLRPLQTAVEGSDGKLWFAGTHGVAWLDAGHVRQEAPLPPPTTIESLSADGKSYELVSPPTLSSNNELWLSRSDRRFVVLPLLKSGPDGEAISPS